MAIDTSVPRSRRALLAGGLGGAAALVASALGRPLPVSAANGDAIKVGGTYSGTNETSVTNTATDAIIGRATNAAGSYAGLTGVTSANTGWGVRGIATNQDAGATGVFGESVGPSGKGVRGWGNGSGVQGYSAAGTGVLGWTYGGATGVVGYSSGSGNAEDPGIALPAKTGVYGRATQSASRGVHGYSPSGRGVYGQATSGVGLYGSATTGYALQASGRVRIDKASGVATIPATKTSVVVTPGLDVTEASFVLLTPKADIGARRIWYSTNATANTFTIRISTAMTSDLKVGWLLLG